MATQSYRERMKAARAQARAQRKAEKAEYRRRLELSFEVSRLALEAVKAGSGQAVTGCRSIPMPSSRRWQTLRSRPSLIEQARARIAERNSEHSHKAAKP